MLKTSRIVVFVLCFFAMLSCHRNDFGIRGTIADGKDRMLYLERNTLKGIIAVDSVLLKSNGRFSFYADKPLYPDIYQLRIGERRFVFPIDSTERITIVAQTGTLSFPDMLEGSDNAVKMQNLRRSVSDLQTLYQNLSSSNISELQTAIARHRHYSDSLIMSNTRSIVAYFAVFQRVGDYYIYSPFEKNDRVYCAAVATGFKTFMPDYERSVSLEAWVLNAIREDRRQQNLLTLQDMVDNAEEPDLDISLKNRNGEVSSLSDLKGKVVLLDFSAIQMDNSPAYMLQLRELYNKYHSRGFEIYQVSADTDENEWLRGTEQLPWVCVRETNPVIHSALKLYNIRQLPTMFVINRKGEVVARHDDFKTIEKDILTNL